MSNRVDSNLVNEAAGKLLLNDAVKFSSNTNNTSMFGTFPISNGNYDLQGAVADVQKGGQNGIGSRILQIDSATPLIMNPCIIVVTQAPTMWKNNPEIGQMLRALWEVDAESIDGIDFGYTVGVADTIVGHDSQSLKMPTQTARTAVNPSVTWTEKYGNIVWGLHYQWLCAMQHPDTNSSYLSTIAALTSNNETSEYNHIPPWILSAFSMSFMAIQPDPTGHWSRIIDAAYYTGVFPTETGNLGLKRQLNTSDKVARTISYTGIVQHNDNTREVGALIMKALQVHRPDYQRAATIPGINADIANFGNSAAGKDATYAYNRMVNDNYTGAKGFDQRGLTDISNTTTSTNSFESDLDSQNNTVPVTKNSGSMV